MDSSIVTLRFAGNYSECDFEIPLQITVDEFCRRLLDILRTIDYKRFAKTACLSIKFNGMLLNPDMTLASYGVWDGSYLDIIENGGI